MINLSDAVQWLEGSFKDWYTVWMSPEILSWSASMALLLTLSIVLPIMRRRKQTAAMEWRRTLATRARA
jgi:hypothetical protein